MSTPTSFRINWRDAEKGSKDKPHIKFVLSAMKSNFNPTIKEGSEPSEAVKNDTSAAKSSGIESSTDKGARKIPSSNPDIVNDQKSSKRNASSSISNSTSNTTEAVVCSKLSKVDLTASKNIPSDSSVIDPKISSQKVSLVEFFKQGSQKESSVKNSVVEPSADRKNSYKKDLSRSGELVKQDINRKRSDKKSDMSGGDSDNMNDKVYDSVQSPSTVLTKSSLKENVSEVKTNMFGSQSTSTEPVQAVDNVRGSDDEDICKKQLARKRALRNRSATRSEGDSEAELQAPGPKRSARRWSKEGESVLQNAIARKEKSLSSIGKSDEDKPLKASIVRNLRENRNSLPSGKRKSNDNASANTDSTTDPKSKSPASLKICSDSMNGVIKQEAQSEQFEVSESSLKISPLKHDLESAGGYTKTGKRRYKPFRGLRYSFSGKTKNIRRSTPPQRNMSTKHHFTEVSTNISSKNQAVSSMKKGLNGIRRESMFLQYKVFLMTF